MIEDTMDNLDEDDMEEDVDSEVAKVLDELTAGTIKISNLYFLIHFWKLIMNRRNRDYGLLNVTMIE